MSPDWAAKVEPVPYAKLGDPQSLNLYGYMLDSPLDGVDQNGHARGCPGGCSSNMILYTNPYEQGDVPSGADLQDAWRQTKSWFSHASYGVAFALSRWGRLGSPEHRDAIKALSELWDKEGYTVSDEKMIKTPNGAKPYRFADVYGVKTNAEGEITSIRIGQIGRTNADGKTPVARERAALRNIENAEPPGTSVEFYDYQAPFPIERGLKGWPVQSDPGELPLDVPTDPEFLP